MQITYNGITIPFFDVEECKNLDNVKLGENGLPEQVLVSLSGGCDSASALYLCLTHFPDIEWFDLGGGLDINIDLAKINEEIVNNT